MEGKERDGKKECEAGGGKEGEGLYSSLEAEREGGVRQVNLSLALLIHPRSAKMRRIALGIS